MFLQKVQTCHSRCVMCCTALCYAVCVTWSVAAACLQGTLREALDRRTLHAPGAKYLSRETILSLTHDIAAALLHLHSQGGWVCTEAGREGMSLQVGAQPANHCNPVVPTLACALLCVCVCHNVLRCCLHRCGAR